ncbi:MAG: DinB family protein [Dehalococcoidia bacterium]
MNAQNAVRQQLGFWHGTLGAVMGDCTEEVAHKTLPGASVDSIAAIYAHALFSQDAITNGMLAGKPPIYITEGWQAKTGVAFPAESPSLAGDWKQGLAMKLQEFHEYGKAVQQSVDSYLAGLSDEDMQRKVSGPFGEQTVEWVVVNILGTHLPAHAGEIAALKGVQGLKGLPF